MPAYILDRSHGPAVKDGRQRLTLQPPRNRPTPAPHADLDRPVYLDLARKGDKPRERVAQAVCILRARVVITEHALVRIVDAAFRERAPHTAEAERLLRFLRAAEQGNPAAGPVARDAVAKLCGFRNWTALWKWNSHRDRRGRPDEAGQVTRELIGWAS